jgi:hypothetical protein
MSPMRIALPVRPATFARWGTVLSGLALCVVLAGCGSHSAPSSQGGTASSFARLTAIGARQPAAAHGATKRALPGSADFVAAVGGDKSAVPVEVRFQLHERPEVGKPVELDVQLTPTAPLGRLVASFHAEDGLAIEQGGAASETDRPTPGVPLSRALTIVARHDGIFYVSATVLVDLGADSVARTFKIPVIAGGGAS